MAIYPGISKRGWILSVAAMSLMGLFPLGHSALAEDHASGAVQGLHAAPDGLTFERSASTKTPPRKPARKSTERSENFVYGIIKQIQAKSEELCARYGSPDDCLEEAEVCLTMRDADDNQVKLCLNTAPGDDEDGKGTVQKSRLKR